jgi:RNA polymerase sigma factor (sigma-70 family)
MNFSENSSLILRKALSGDNAAWDALFAGLWPIVAGVAAVKAKAVGGDALVDDIAQNVFIRLTMDNAKRLRRFDPDKGTLESYVAKIAGNCAVDDLRGHARHFRTVDISSLPEPVAPTDSSLPMLEEWEMVAALNSLAPREKEVIELLFKRDLTVAEAASHMRISPETVRSEKSHALKKLKRFFGQA